MNFYYLCKSIDYDIIISNSYTLEIITGNFKSSNIIKDIKLYKDEPTFRSVITEIIDELKNI